MEDTLIIVDEYDNEIGTGSKIDIHRKGILHRAFSIFVFNKKGQLLLQQRSSTKYHSGGLWTNTCCSHQRKGENLETSIHRRLIEEMGFDSELTEIFTFTYRANLDHRLIENEFDHVFVGEYEGKPIPNIAEVEGFKWINLTDLQIDIEKNPNNYTYWFKLVLSRVIKYYIDLHK
jgi:isopentenyl-diphosphate Delta-isomerase